MAKTREVNKTQTVRDYVKANPKATNKEISEALGKEGIKISPNHVANIKATIRARRRAKKQAAAKPAAAVPAIPAVAGTLAPAAERPTKPGETITLEQVKKVAHTVRAIGGFERLNELLGIIKEVGGLKKFKDLLEAMAVTATDDIPF